MHPNEFAKNEGFFHEVSTWAPKTGNLNVKECPHCSMYTILINIAKTYTHIYTYANAGFHPQNTLFKSQHENFVGNAINIVMPNESVAFSKVWTYPENTGIRAGSDFWTAHYLSEALNFKFQYVLFPNHTLGKLMFSFISNLQCRVLDSIDGQWGSLVDRGTNSFNGMIGMIQRNESSLFSARKGHHPNFCLVSLSIRRQLWQWEQLHRQKFVRQQLTSVTLIS